MEVTISIVPPDPMLDEFNRLRSFPLVWGSEFGFTKSELAKGGIYYDQVIHLYKCVFCQISIDVCTQGELFSTYHNRLSLKCPIVIGTADNNKPLEEICNFRFEQHRLVSFLRTSWTVPVDPYDLAKWGFHWTGKSDVCRCAFCWLEVRRWQVGDRGEKKHRSWNSSCELLREEGVTNNVRLGMEDPNVMEPQDRSLVRRKLMTNIGIQRLGTKPDMTTTDIGVILDIPPHHPEYAARAVRFDSYTWWPRSLSQRPQQLVEAGFYYTGRSDCVACYYCGGGLKDWANGDQPWVEHAVWFQRCPFLLHVKGPEFVKQVQTIKEGKEQSRDPSLTASVVQGGEPSLIEKKISRQETAEATVKTESRQVEEVSDTRACKVCFVKELGIVFLPCGHMATCPDCAPQLTMCPICRSPAQAYARVFLP